MLSPSDIRPAVESVLRAADRSLTSYEILDRLPDNLLQQIIAERGMPGLGSGNSYSAASLVTDAAEHVLPSLEPPYRVYVHGQAVFTVAGQEIRQGNNAIALYRLHPPTASADTPNPIVPTALSHSPAHVLKREWFEKPGTLVFWFFLFWPVFLVGMHLNGKAAIAKGRIPWYEETAWLVFSVCFFPLFYVALFSNRNILSKWKWSLAAASIAFSAVYLQVYPPHVTASASPSAQSSSAVATTSYHYSTSSPKPSAAVSHKKSSHTNPTRQQAWKNRIAAEKDYVTRIGDLTGSWGEAYQKIGSLLSQYANMPELAQDETWRTDFVAAMVTAQYLSKQIQSIENVPDNAKRHHRLWSQAAREGDKGLKLIVQGVDKHNGDYVTQGVPHFHHAVELSNAANDELENMKQRFLKEAANH